MTDTPPRPRTLPMLRRAPWLPVAGLMVVLVAAVAAILLSREVTRSNSWVTHSLRAQVTITEIAERLAGAEAGVRGYMLASNEDLLEDGEAARSGIDARLKLLEREFADNPVQMARLETVRRQIAGRLHFLDQRIETYRRAGHYLPPTQEEIRTSGRVLAREVRDSLDRMFFAERRLMAERQMRSQRLTQGLSIGLALTVLLVVIVAYVTVRDARARYREAREAHRAARSEAIARIDAEAQLSQVHKMESIGQLSGGIAHDFNNMLAVIIGSLDMARRRADQPERVQRHIASALDGAERAATLVQRLLAFSRRQPLAPVAIWPNAMINGMTDLLQRSLGEKVAITVLLQGDAWPILADPGHLENALLNLAVNARDAMPDGGTLTVRTANHALSADDLRGAPDVGAGDYAMIAVEDEGTGMSEEVRARAFDPFFTTKGVGKGTGLGLSQVFGFVKQSGGHVALEPREGGGTIVRLFLPRTHDLPEKGGRAGAGDAQAGRGERILVVEDDERVRTFSIEALRDLGYEPIAAENGAAALDLLKVEAEPDLLFTDVVMPGIGGPELARIVRAARPSVRILYTTGYAREQQASLRGLDPDMRVLAKPFTVAQLAQRVREALDA